MSSPAARAVDRRPRSARGEGARLRAEIVAAAHLLLDESGEEAVTLRAIARRIGISAPSIYRHFPDRQAILLAVAEDAFAELAERLRRADNAGGDPAARLHAVCTAYLNFARERPRRYSIMFGGTWDAARAVQSGAIAAEQVSSLGAAALGLIGSALQRCRSRNVTADELHAEATVVWVGLHGLAHQRLVAPGFPWPSDIENRVVAALTRRPPATRSTATPPGSRSGRGAGRARSAAGAEDRRGGRSS